MVRLQSLPSPCQHNPNLVSRVPNCRIHLLLLSNLMLHHVEVSNLWRCVVVVVVVVIAVIAVIAVINVV